MTIDHTKYSAHRSPDGYVDFGGEPIKKIKVDMSKLYIFKDDGIYKATKHGFRKIRKPSSNIKSELASTN